MVVLYSKLADIACGNNIYRLKDGTEVVGTAVYEEDQVDKYLWADKVILGELDKFVRVGERANFVFDYMSEF